MNREDLQKYRVIVDGEPTPDERYHIFHEFEMTVHGCPMYFIIRRTVHLDAEIEIKLNNHRGVRFATNDPVRLNVLRLAQFAIPAGQPITITTSGPDGWRAMREMMYILSQHDSVYAYYASPYRDRGMLKQMYEGYMWAGVERDENVEREILATQKSLVEPGGRHRGRQDTLVSCDRCSERSNLLKVMLVSYTADHLWAGSMLCDFCYLDLAFTLDASGT